MQRKMLIGNEIKKLCLYPSIVDIPTQMKKKTIAKKTNMQNS